MRPVPHAVLWMLPLVNSKTLHKSQNYEAIAECLVAGASQLNNPECIKHVLSQVLGRQNCIQQLNCHSVKQAWKSWFKLDSKSLLLEEQQRNMQHGSIQFCSMAFAARTRSSYEVHQNTLNNCGTVFEDTVLREILNMLKNLHIRMEEIENCKHLLSACLTAAFVLAWALPNSNQSDRSSLIQAIEVIRLICFNPY